MDIMTILYIVLMGAMCLFFGRFMDKRWRAKMMRNVFKKNYTILRIMSKEGNRVVNYIINLDKDLISVGTEKWAVQSRHVYVEGDAARGFVANEKSIQHWDEGLPVITVDRDSVKPIGYYKDTTGSVKPEEVGATFGAWIANEIAKGMGAVGNMNSLILVACILSLAAGGISYMIYGQVDALSKDNAAMHSDMDNLIALNYDALVGKGLILPTNVTIQRQG